MVFVHKNYSQACDQKRTKIEGKHKPNNNNNNKFYFILENNSKIILILIIMAVLIYLFSKIKAQSFYCGRKPQGRAAYGKYHIHKYFSQYRNHDYSTILGLGVMTK